MAKELIKEIRKRLGLSQHKLAMKLGLSAAQIISFWECETRHPSIKHCYVLIELAKEVGMDLTLEDFKPRT